MAGFRERKYSTDESARRFSSSASPNVGGRTRAAGFGGLETGGDGNLRPASYLSVYGKAPSADQAQTNPIRDVYADIPRPNAAQSSGAGMGVAIAAKVGEKVLDRALKKGNYEFVGDNSAGPDAAHEAFYGSNGSGAPDSSIQVYTAPGAGNSVGDAMDAWSGAGGEIGEAAGNTVGDAMDAWSGAGGEIGEAAGNTVGDAMDAWGGWGADAAGEAAGDAVGAFGDFGGFGGYVGPVMKLASGDIGGALKQGAGVAIGTAIGGPIGGAIGGLIGGGCFITEATMAGLGMQGPELEQAEPLQVLRWFRDNVMMSSPQGKNLVQQYYLMAPEVVEAVNQRPDALQIYQAIYGQYLKPAVEAVKAGDYQKALGIYTEMINFVAPFAAEMDPGVGEDLSESAAMVQADPGMQAQIAAPEGEPQAAPPFMRNIIARR